MRKALAIVFTTAALLSAGIGAANAGESQGNSTPGHINETGMRAHANSDCGFSGQNPERFLPVTDKDYEPGRVQNWGHIPADVKVFLTAAGHNPGIACNGHLSGRK